MLIDDGTGREPRAKALTMRLPASVDEYVRKRGAARKDGMTGVIDSALRLHQLLSERASEHKLSLQRFALDEKLDWATQEPEVYVRLVLRGLKDVEKRRK